MLKDWKSLILKKKDRILCGLFCLLAATGFVLIASTSTSPLYAGYYAYGENAGGDSLQFQTRAGNNPRGAGVCWGLGVAVNGMVGEVFGARDGSVDFFGRGVLETDGEFAAVLGELGMLGLSKADGVNAFTVVHQVNNDRAFHLGHLLN